jgi:hypothetical protein
LNNTITITQYLPSDKFHLSVFASVEFLKLKAGSNEYGYFCNDRFALPFFIEKYLHIKRLKFTEAVIKNIELNSEISEQKNFLNDVIELIKKDKIADFIAPPMAHCVFEVVPENTDYIGWGSYVLNLDKQFNSDEDIFKLFPHKYRNRINKGLDEGVKAVEIEDIETVYEIISDTFKRQKSPYAPSLEFLSNLKKSLGDQVKFVAAYKDDKIQGVVVILVNRFGAFNYYAGSIEKPSNGSLNVLQYEVIRLLINLKVQTYDYMGARLIIKKGSKFEGIQKYKKSVGTELKKGFIFGYIVNDFNHRLFNLMVKSYSFITSKEYEGDVILQVKKLEAEHQISKSPDIIIIS